MTRASRKAEIDGAWLAVRRMHAMTPELTAMATEMLRRPVRVQVHPTTNYSEGGDVIYLAPPVELADSSVHSCITPSSESSGTCGACRSDLTVRTALRHEVGHFTVGTFGPVTHAAIREATASFRSVSRCAHADDDAPLKRRCEQNWAAHLRDIEVGKSKLHELSCSSTISYIYNFIEDVRINLAIVSSFPESQEVFWKFYTRRWTDEKVFAHDDSFVDAEVPSMNDLMIALSGMAQFGTRFKLHWISAEVRRMLLACKGEHKRWAAAASSSESMILAYRLWARLIIAGFIDDDHHPRVKMYADAVGGGCATRPKKLKESDVEKAIEEHGAGYDGPSYNLTGTTWHEFGSPIWRKRYHRAIEPSPFVGAMLAESRRIFQANDRSGKVTSRAGKINTRRLSRAGLGLDDIFYHRIAPEKTSYHVSLAADCSGSMADGTRMTLLRQALADQAEILSKLNISFEIIGHSGASGLDLFPVKTTRDRWDHEARIRLANLSAYMANLDGHTLEVHLSRVMATGASRQIIIYYTDGAMPAENYTEELNVLLSAIDRAQRAGVIILCVGINTTCPKKYGLNTVRYDKVSDLSSVIRSLTDLLRG